MLKGLDHRITSAVVTVLVLCLGVRLSSVLLAPLLPVLVVLILVVVIVNAVLRKW